MRNLHAGGGGVEIEDLRVFVETVRRGSLSIAAESLGMSQPTVSRRIRRLEAAVGAPLLERTRPAVSPTRLGLRWLAFAESTLLGWDALRAEPEAPESALRGLLHVAASTTLGEFFLPGVLARFSRLHADVRAHLHVMNSDSVEECVRARHCDLGFLGRPPRSPLLRGVVVAEDEVVLAHPPGHRFSGRGEVDLAELTGESLVQREPGSGTRQAVEAALAARGASLPPLHGSGEMGSGRALAGAVEAGQGLGFVSSLLAGGRFVRVRGLPIRRPLLLIYEPTRLRRVGESFVAFVTARLPLTAERARPPG